LVNLLLQTQLCIVLDGKELIVQQAPAQ